VLHHFSLAILFGMELMRGVLFTSFILLISQGMFKELDFLLLLLILIGRFLDLSDLLERLQLPMSFEVLWNSVFMYLRQFNRFPGTCEHNAL